MRSDRSKKRRSASEARDEAEPSFELQLMVMFKALWASPVRSTLLLLGAAILLVVIATSYGQIRLNGWNQPFYDALSHRQVAQFLLQLGVFALIAGSLLALNVAQKWLGEMLKVKLREGLVHDLVRNWLQPPHAFRLAHAGPIGVNPDQRMHEDARHLTELSVDLGVGLLQAAILLAVFAEVLWAISSQFSVRVAGRVWVIHGYMVWAAIVYAGSASLLSYWVGRNLIRLNADRYAREADLRFSLVRVNEHIDAISLAGGEAGEARRIERDLAGVLLAMRRLVTGLTNLTWITSGYGWFTLVAPILAAAPLYFAGYLSFGGLMMAAGAFNQVQSSLRWFVDNFSTIADWRATLLRVASFRFAVLSTTALHPIQSRIAFTDGEPDKIALEHLEIASPSGCVMLKEARAQIKAGEHVLIVGEAGAGKTLLFRALAGLWPWGSGQVSRPKDQEIYYMPRTSYLPPGTLREVLAYPLNVEHFTDKAFNAALQRLELKRLAPLLDKSRRWDRELSEDEQQALALARLVLRSPAWVIMDEVLDSLEGKVRECAVDVLTKDFGHACVIHIGRSEPRDHLFSRTLHLINDPKTRTLPRKRLGEQAEMV
jgi:putative ATP-binding cassette transporter